MWRSINAHRGDPEDAQKPSVAARARRVLGFEQLKRRPKSAMTPSYEKLPASGFNLSGLRDFFASFAVKGSDLNAKVAK
jgi:hypothetical protein